ncbi:MAG: M20/M25/M40 family metallo-hydrolase, partial [Lachnospiraceae bacterium]|nr:M20/M25/M40 family metallo-hydrolase [Lachnospiraceae bacterium]
MGVLDKLVPEKVFYYFEEICKIPHGSRNTKAISDYCVAFARDRGLAVTQDEDNNVIIFKEGSEGYEQSRPVIIQGHLDMVCEKEEGCIIDFEKDGLDLAIDGDYIYARGTTLGGDDGIAVAMALAILDDDSIVHPPLEVVLTVDEEIGMLGAVSMDCSPLKGRLMLNLDSEVEGQFLIGCAGGMTAKCVFPAARRRWGGKPVSVSVSGVTGGHSGVEIIKEGANANVVLGRVLYALK